MWPPWGKSWAPWSSVIIIDPKNCGYQSQIEHVSCWSEVFVHRNFHSLLVSYQGGIKVWCSQCLCRYESGIQIELYLVGFGSEIHWFQQPGTLSQQVTAYNSRFIPKLFLLKIWILKTVVQYLASNCYLAPIPIKYKNHHLPHSQESIEISCKTQAFGYAYLVHHTSEVITAALYCKH